MWEGCAAQISRDFQFSCGQYYPGLRLLRPLPVQELFCWTFDLTPRAAVPTCHYRSQPNDHVQSTLG